MAEGYISKHINPPDIVNFTLAESLTTDVAKQIMSEGGWYQVRAINGATSGANGAFILSSDQTKYYYAMPTVEGNYKRTVTPPFYFPKGSYFCARAFFTDTDASGVFFTKEVDV